MDSDHAVSGVMTIHDCADCSVGMGSVIRQQKHLHEFHLVQGSGGYDSTMELYPGFQQDLATKLRIPIYWHAGELDLQKVTTRALIYIQPDHQVSDSAMDTLLEELRQHNGWYSGFAVRSVLYVEGQGEKTSIVEKLSFCCAKLSFLGFLLVATFLDSIRSLYSCLRYHNTTDLRAQTLQVRYPKQVSIHKTRWYLWWILTRVRMRQSSGAGLLQVVDDPGIEHVLRTLKHHAHLGIGLWILLLFVPYYLLYAIPWWANGATTTSVSPVIDTVNWFMQRFLKRQVNMTNIWYTSHALHLALVGIVCSRRMRLPYNALSALILLYPVFLTLSPLVFLYARWHVSHKSWEVSRFGGFAAKSKRNPKSGGGAAKISYHPIAEQAM